MREFISDAVRTQVIERAHNRCEYCCLPYLAGTATFQVDHIYPVAYGGAAILHGLVPNAIVINQFRPLVLTP